LYTLRETCTYFWFKDAKYDDTRISTLHDAARHPGALSWVLLFNGASLKWDSDGIIFVKSNLGLLPAIQSSAEAVTSPAPAVDVRGDDEAGEEGGVKLPTDLAATGDDEEAQKKQASHDEHSEVASKAALDQPTEGAPVDHAPIAIFSQPVCRASRFFKFIGWYKVVRLQLIEPKSEELVRMLTKKWETKDRYGPLVSRQRDAMKWRESVLYRWAVIKMEKDEKSMGEKGEPKIERLAEDESAGSGTGKSVNEMLAEMRLRVE
jgi:hypothetical protein